MKAFKDYLVITLGVFLVATGIYFFMIPNEIAGGGINGLAIVINNYVPSMPIGIIMLIIDCILYVVAFIVIGPEFGGKTIFSSLLLSFTIFILEKFVPLESTLTGDMFMEMLFGIITSAVGMAIIFEKDGSTGGTDIIAKILNKYFHINMGKGILMVDLIVVLLALNAFGLRKALYALFAVILNGIVIDKAIEGLNTYKEVRIISPKLEEIESFILNKLGRGATVYSAKGSYSNSQIEVLWTIVDRKEFIELKKFIKKIDPKAFLSVSEAYEILGEGFEKLT